MDLLATELDQVKSLILALHPRAGAENDNAAAPSPPVADLASGGRVMSVAASATHFNEYIEEQSSQTGSSIGSWLLRRGRRRLDGGRHPHGTGSPAGRCKSAFFRRTPAAASFTVSPSEEYLRELHACWRDTKALSQPTYDG